MKHNEQILLFSKQIERIEWKRGATDIQWERISVLCGWIEALVVVGVWV